MAEIDSRFLAKLLAEYMQRDPAMMRLVTDYAKELKDVRPNYIIYEEREWDD
jgi:F420-0:gamma-glutamyl ligase